MRRPARTTLLLLSGVVTLLISGTVAIATDLVELSPEDEEWREEARERFEEGRDQLTPVNIPDRYGVEVNGESFIVLESTTFETEGHYREITRLINHGEWEGLRQYGELTTGAQQLMDDGEVKEFLEEHGHLQEE